MSYKKWAMPVAVLIVASLALTACPAPTPPVPQSAPTVVLEPTAVEPTATPTAVEPTATPTAVEPTATPTAVAPTATPTVVEPTAAPTAVDPTAAPTGPVVVPPTLQGLRLAPIGHPTWKPVDFHLFAAPYGKTATGYASLDQTALAVLSEPNHKPVPGLLSVGPGAPHAPPYTAEIAAGVVAAGYHEGVRFTTSEFSEGMGVYLAWMNVPIEGTTGSSPDFDSGPIIPNNLFPFFIIGKTVHNGREFDGDSLATQPLAAPNKSGFNVDGASHLPGFVAANADFGPSGTPLVGSYTYRIEINDTAVPMATWGPGWRIEVDFTIVP